MHACIKYVVIFQRILNLYIPLFLLPIILRCYAGDWLFSSPFQNGYLFFILHTCRMCNSYRCTVHHLFILNAWTQMLKHKEVYAIVTAKRSPILHALDTMVLYIYVGKIMYYYLFLIMSQFTSICVNCMLIGTARHELQPWLYVKENNILI